MHVENLGTSRSQKIGFVAIVSLWITAFFVVPLQKILCGQFQFPPEQILIVRSLACVAVALVISRGRAWRSSRRVVIAGFLMAASSVGFFRAIAVWDINPVMVMLTLIPVGNMLIAVMEGRKIAKTTSFGLALIAAGTACALEPWNRSVNVEGFLWAISCVILSAFGFDQWGKSSEKSTVSETCFWMSFWNVVLAYLTMKILRLEFEAARMLEPEALKPLVIFTSTVTIYIFCSIVPFNRVGKMNTVTASILLQVATPVVILGAYFFVGETLLPRQWVGVGCALAGATLLSVQTIRASNAKPSSKG